MARILRVRKSGEPAGFSTRSVEGFTGNSVGADRVGRAGVRRVFARDPNKMNSLIGTDQDVISVLRGVPAVAASLTTAFAGANNDLRFTAKPEGAVGNTRRIAFVVAGANTPLSIAVAGNDITVNVATNGASAATSTAAQVRTAVLASAAAMALLGSVEFAVGNDGTGVVGAMAMTAFAGGTNAVTTEAGTPNQVAGPNPTILNGSQGARLSTIKAGVKRVVNRGANRRISKR